MSNKIVGDEGSSAPSRTTSTGSIRAARPGRKIRTGHPFRRLWASARKDLLDVDVARAGGWSSLQALQQAYQQPDDETMLRVVEHEAELRKVR